MACSALYILLDTNQGLVKINFIEVLLENIKSFQI